MRGASKERIASSTCEFNYTRKVLLSYQVMFGDFYSPGSYIDNSYIQEKSYVSTTKVRILYKKCKKKSHDFYLLRTKSVPLFPSKASAISTSSYV